MYYVPPRLVLGAMLAILANENVATLRPKIEDERLQGNDVKSSHPLKASIKDIRIIITRKKLPRLVPHPPPPKLFTAWMA
ncbi:hypothetical protein L210DRAFT_951253 [Boletus edulis BED1]|uniref:Uncharacterized protein n=1 Tax=Boletus edulis BED1 TaxID=1328754 RepID=A0AAD4BGP2_BOLED|nr:hypothetical protein L210DRAFT_951253 [Boletus edulis BED1]